jgi:NAD(P)-dependent dehydrogenase (short-subunit alcohol dehydrogenase family)
MKELTGRVAVITGAASGIGLAMANAFAAEGMNIVLADVDEAGLNDASKRLNDSGTRAIAVPTDVREAAALDALRDAAVSAFGAAHVICNNAGIGVGGPIWQVPLESWEWVFAVNFWGVVHGIRSFVPLLLEQGEGHVVNTASAAGLVAAPFLGPYSATKFAVVAASETLAMELNGTGIGVSVLCPLWVRTRIHESDRNAPPEVAALVGDESVFAGARDVIAGFIEAGLAPEIVAERVVEAVKTGGFWILPHEEMRQAVRDRAESIAAGDLPAFTIFT